MSVVFTVALTLLVSYLLGCFNGSVMTSHFIIRDDVRQHGSGNAGLTNFYRTYGARYALCVIVCDMGKTVLACLIGGYLMHWVVGDWTLGLLIAGIGCELGHMFPVFFGLRGGKGILSGGVLVLVPLLSAFCAEDEATLFPRSLSIMLPICVCSLLVQYRASPPPLPGMLPYLIGGALGGSLSAFIRKRVPLVWLHRFFGLILLWSGFRCLFL